MSETKYDELMRDPEVRELFLKEVYADHAAEVSELRRRISALTAERDALAEKLKRLSAQVEAGASLDSGNCWHRWGLDTCIRRGDHQKHLTKYGYEWDDSCICNGRGCTRCCGPS
jgi:hypothetical protein